MTLISYEATVLDCQSMTLFKVNIIVMRFNIPRTLAMKIVLFVDIVLYNPRNTVIQSMELTLALLLRSSNLLFKCSYHGLFDRDVVAVHGVYGLPGSQQQHTQVVSHQHGGIIEDPVFSEHLVIILMGRTSV